MGNKSYKITVQIVGISIVKFVVAIHNRTVFPITSAWVTSKAVYALQEDLYREAVEETFRQVLFS